MYCLLVRRDEVVLAPLAASMFVQRPYFFFLLLLVRITPFRLQILSPTLDPSSAIFGRIREQALPERRDAKDTHHQIGGDGNPGDGGEEIGELPPSP